MRSLGNSGVSTYLKRESLIGRITVPIRQSVTKSLYRL
nr:MAG TPA: hypothetical protein [Caudoviricetes sp.]DAP10460.1 MAG TPA: hypothetical protein [Caudoviricetes sp.]